MPRDAEYFKQWRAKNKDKVKKYVERWRTKNPGKQAQYIEKWRATHPDKQAQYVKKCKDKNKTYNTKQAAELLGVTYHALRKQLDRDAKKPRKERKYPNAKHCACGHFWMIPGRDIKKVGDE
jgi:uncharacterized protein HemY